MPQLDFQIYGVTKETIRGTRKSQRSRLFGFTTPVILVALVLGAVYGGRFNQPGRKTLLLGGKEVVANRVLVLVDNSGSMTDEGERVKRQLDQFTAARVDVRNQLPVIGFAFSESYPYSLISVLRQALAAEPSIDTVYFISDFDQGDELDNRPQGIRTFEQLISNARVRLYLATVKNPPTAVYFDVARRSGGDVISVF